MHLEKKTISTLVIALLLLTLFVPALPVAGQAPSAPSMFRANPEHTGVYDNGGIVPGNQLLWNYTTGGGVTSSPAVANGIVYVTSQDGNAYAFNATTGEPAWAQPFHTGSSVSSSPAVVNGVVYFGSLDGNLHALNAATGQPVWPQPFHTGGISRSSPTVVNGLVYVGSYDHNLYAVNAATGAKVWSYTTGGQIVCSPTVANGVVYLWSMAPDSNFYALNAFTGQPVWPQPFHTYTAMSSIAPAVSNGVVYVGSGWHTASNTYSLYAINANNGAILWNYTTPNPVRTSPAVANGVVYFATDLWDGKFYALNANNAALLWNSGPYNGTIVSPAYANGVVYYASNYASSGGTLYALSATSGIEFWNYKVNDMISDSLAVAKGVVYIGGGSGNFYAIGNQQTPIPTTVTAGTPSAAFANQNFTVKGQLTANGVGLGNRTVTLQRSPNNVTWSSLSGMKTNDTGGYTFTRSETATGTYYYRTIYAGSPTYANSTSNVMKVDVARTPTALTISAPDVAQANQAFSISGTATTNGTAFANRTASLYRYNAGTDAWTKVASMKTDTNGNYTFSRTESATGTYGYMVMYAGSATYRPSTSTSAWVDVV